MPTLAEELGIFAAELDLDVVPERVRRKARHQTMAVLGALYAGQGSAEAAAVRRVVEARAGTGNGAVRAIPGRSRAGTEDALLAAAAATMALDFDDYVFAGHTGHSAVLVPLLLGAEIDAPGREVLAAQIVANEVGGRLGAATSIGPHNGQLWAHIHALGAACAAGRLLGLDADRIADAIGIALYAPPFPLIPGFMGSGAKVLTAALPAWIGLTAARLAAAGMRGARGIIEDRRGFLHHFAYSPAPFFLTGLGRAWLTDTIAYKVYPGCAYIGSTVDALLALRAREGLEPRDVESVDVRCSAVTFGMQRLSEAHVAREGLEPVNINFSIPFNVALTLLHGRLDPRVLAPASLRENEHALRALAARVRVVHDWEMTARLGAALDASLHLRRALPELDLRGVLRARRELLGAAPGRGAPIEIGSLLRAAAWTARGATRRRRQVQAPAPAGGYDLGRADLESFTFPFGAEIALRTSSGRIHEARVDTPRGTPGPWEDSFRWTEEKLTREAEAAKPDSHPRRILDIVRRYEHHSPREVLDAI